MAKIEIKEQICKKCNLCTVFCPQNVFGLKGTVKNIEACNDCGVCQILCPERAIIHKEEMKTKETEIEENKKERRGGWNKKPTLLKERKNLLSGNEACAQAALDSGCLFYAGYPITPASEIMQYMQKLRSIKNGVFIQMEDEISSLAAVIGASWTGKKAMTATSGPGFSLMQENIGYAVITETPCVIVDVQRAGPSTGQATRPATADLMQAIWGSHADSQKVVLSPTSAQECYDLTILAFNISEIFRTPVIILMDEITAHLKEEVVIPEEVSIFERIYEPKEKPFGTINNGKLLVPSMPAFGDNEELTITGSTHYPSGVRAASDPSAQDELTEYLSRKIESIDNSDFLEKNNPDFSNIPKHPQIILISHGSTVRSVKLTAKRMNEKGFRVGTFFLKKIWPFPYENLKKIKIKKAKNALITVVEMNQGQLLHLIREVFPEAFLISQNKGLPIEPLNLQKLLEEILGEQS